MSMNWTSFRQVFLFTCLEIMTKIFQKSHAKTCSTATDATRSVGKEEIRLRPRSGMATVCTFNFSASNNLAKIMKNFFGARHIL